MKREQLILSSVIIVFAYHQVFFQLGNPLMELLKFLPQGCGNSHIMVFA